MCAADIAILCIGGDADSLAIIDLSLRLDDALRTHSANGDDAFQWLTSGQRPAAVVIDADMLAPNSVELARAIKALAIQPPPAIILVTSAPVPDAAATDTSARTPFAV